MATAPPAERAPAGRLTLEALRAEAEAGRIDTVVLALPDLWGKLTGKRFDALHFVNHVAGHSAEMCSYVLAADVLMNPVDFPLSNWANGHPDLQLVPDLDTLRVVPWMEGAALVHGDAWMDGRPVSVAPRQMLRRRLERLAERGYTAKVGLETEFVVYEGAYDRLVGEGPGAARPLSAGNRDYALDHDPRTTRFLRTLQRHLRGAGLPVEAAKTESAGGQVEITFPYGDPMTACDQHTLLKHAARATGYETGTSPTFMASPTPGVGSGLHLHVSLWDEEGLPVFPAAGGEMSAVTEHSVAGLLTALPELAPLYAGNENSYRRYSPETYAPTAVTWGLDNRTCAIRVVGPGTGNLHLEVRTPGANANPYLALSAVLASMEHGIDQALKAPAATVGNAYEQHLAPALPGSLEAATAAFRTSRLAGDLLGYEVVEHYTLAAGIETAAAAATAGAGRDEVAAAEWERWFEHA